MKAPVALTHVTVIAGDAAGTVHPEWTVLVGADGIIEYAGPAAEAVVPPGYATIAGAGKFVIPGLINAHAHLFSNGKPLSKVYMHPKTEQVLTRFMRGPLGQALMRGRTKRNALNQLHSGVTTIRTVGDVAFEVMAIRERIERGELVGPRILPSGPLLAIPNGHGAPQIAHEAETPDQARTGTRINLSHGARSIKISATGGVTDAKGIGHAGTPEMSEEAMTAICAEAHAAGVLVAAHAQSAEGVRRALRAGVDTIEHGSSMDDEMIALYRDNPRSLRGWSAMIPTLQACLPLVKLDQSFTKVSDVVKANAEFVLEEMLSGIRSALENDIALGVGSDSSVTYVTHSNTWRELDCLVRFGGLTAAQALHAVTQVNARILGLDQQLGSIAAGKAADLVLLEQNPLEALRTLQHPVSVIARGTVIEHPAITRIEAIDDQLDSF
ncbi:amidohydrolase family protein [Leucobacter tenebrionis]|uniref:amidohydrolase family protein n=1 Tax=Leucobacter tenebrionis TaxID=2873270 RepID=UPI001CA651C5|nr:amidohydrolase family protein [Leucobacter tenebrionis]QZY51346.1 amidohydrolase family protein [Leucobacter tenebrionis]